jgi:hypothetical protein
MNTPKEKGLLYVIVVIVITIIFYIILGFITSALFIAGPMGQ